MEHIKQLKSIRDEALVRLQTKPDYKLLTSLDKLIVELEGVSAMDELTQKNIKKEATAKPTVVKLDTKTPPTLDDAFEKLSFDKKANASLINGPIVNVNGPTTSMIDLVDEINGGTSFIS